jgi:hypothetical protein
MPKGWMMFRTPLQVLAFPDYSPHADYTRVIIGQARSQSPRGD